MLDTVQHLLAMIRFSHTLFALPFALLAAVMAWHSTPFRWQALIGILLAMATARSFAMAVNRLADQQIDAANPRTAGRHLPAGILSRQSVWIFAVLNGTGFLASTCLFLPNWLPLLLAIPVLGFLAGYSYAKRFTPLSHFWLGAALALAPIATWIAICGDAVVADPSSILPALVLAGAILSWVGGFDIIYACQDYEFDRQTKLQSVPARVGIARALQIAAACHLVTVVLLASLPLVYPPLGVVYWLGVGGGAILLVYEHALVRPNDLNRVNIAFFNINAVISLGLFAIGSLDLWLGLGR